MSDTPRVECAVEDHGEGEYCEFCPPPETTEPCPCGDPEDCDGC